MKKTLALLLALVMVVAVAACGADPVEEPAAASEAAAPVAAAPAPAGDASGEPSSEASGEASGAPSGEPPAGTHPDSELMEPTAAYSKDLDGYKAYAIDALKTDPLAQAATMDAMIANIEAAADPSDDAFRKLSDPGRILVYEDFLNY